jgi:hypothetical protein
MSDGSPRASTASRRPVHKIVRGNATRMLGLA